MSEIITHTYVTTKPNSPDSSLVSADAWEDGHKLLGGLNGQGLVFDNTRSKNVRWRDGTSLNAAAFAYTGASPTAEIGLLSFTLNSQGLAVFFVDYICVSSNASGGTVLFTLDGAAYANFTYNGTGVSTQLPIRVTGLTAGNHTFTVRFVMTSGAVTFTSLNGETHYLISGV